MNRGIFENFPNPPVDKKDSPFAIAPESAETAAAGSPFTAVSSPFSAGGTQGSPFSVGDEKKDGFEAQEYKEISKKDSLFQVAEQVAGPSEGFGFEAPVTTADTAPGTSPFEAVSGAGAPATSSFTTAEKTISEDAAMTAAESDSFGDPNSDSYSIRQLELRAIFGVDREMTTEEILQRARALPGIRNVARVSPQDMSAVEGIKNLLPNLGFGSGALKLYIGSVPLEFIREGKELLAVQTDGGFAPGVRETLILVARELGRSA